MRIIYIMGNKMLSGLKGYPASEHSRPFLWK